MHSKGTKNGEDVHVMFQTEMGGGGLLRNAETGETSLPQRDLRFLNGFDLFRKPASETTADIYHERFMKDVVEKYLANDPKIMQSWASRPEKLDLNEKSIWEQYYNNAAHYYKLREIKKTVDPDDLFHSRFTLRPAE